MNWGKMSAEGFEVIRERLAASNNDWPSRPFSNADKQAEFLERRLARAIGGREIVFATATVEGVRGNEQPRRYVATLFTEDAIFSGHLTVDLAAMYPPSGDVRIIPRTAIRSLTLHHVEHDDSSARPDLVSFTATFDGLEPVAVGLPRWGIEGESSASLFDSLQSDLIGSLPATTVARG
ncbi:hypothetical protein [Pseudarthrobacter sp. TAF60_1]|uniref:hypothetical protein n=1 Tax=Pseudarthrobacter sp. TAF60_1 TaxID=3233071 RepID=UPI003F9CCD50